MAKTLFRGPVLQGKFNESGVTGFNLENKTANYTVTNADSGKTFTSSTDGVVFTLPAISKTIAGALKLSRKISGIKKKSGSF